MKSKYDYLKIVADQFSVPLKGAINLAKEISSRGGVELKLVLDQ